MAYTTVTQGPLDEGFLISEASGFRSRDTVTLKSGAVYVAGSVISAEIVSSAPTGFWILAPDTATTAAVLCRTTDATGAATKAAVIARDAEVKDDALTLASGTSLAEATAILKATGIIVRTTI